MTAPSAWGMFREEDLAIAAVPHMSQTPKLRAVLHHRMRSRRVMEPAPGRSAAILSDSFLLETSMSGGACSSEDEDNVMTRMYVAKGDLIQRLNLGR
jgi:hypothetical protein